MSPKRLVNRPNSLSIPTYSSKIVLCAGLVALIVLYVRPLLSVLSDNLGSLSLVKGIGIKDAFDTLGLYSLDESCPGSCKDTSSSLATAERQILVGLRLGPPSSGKYRLLGLVYLAQSDLEAADENFRIAGTLFPPDYWVQFWHGFALTRLGQQYEAIHNWREIKAARFLVVVATYYERERRYADAVKAYQLAVRIAQDSSNKYYDLYTSALAYLGLERVYRSAGQYQEAVSAGRMAVELDPWNIDYRIELALTLNATGNREEAIVLLQQAIKLDPRRADYRLYLGNIYLETRQYALAESELIVARELAEPLLLPEVLESLGRVYQANNQWHLAEGAFLDSLELSPNRASSRLALALGYASQGFDELAIEQLEIVSEGPSKDYAAISLVHLSRIYGELGQIEESRVACEKAISIQPERPDVQSCKDTLMKLPSR